MQWNPFKILWRLIKLGRLNKGDDERPKPYKSAGPMMAVPRKVAGAIPMRIRRKPWRPCDRCGFSEVDAQPIARAQYQIEVDGGTLYFCGHHFRKHCAAFMTSGYHIFDIREKVAAK